MKYVCCWSGGKDSTALLLKLLELNYPLDEVYWFCMGDAEFDCMHQNAEKMEQILTKKGIKFTVEYLEHDFCWYMTEKPVQKKDGSMQCGYHWCGGVCRWGTSMKLEAIRKYLSSYKNELVAEYVGIAADERHRINRKRNGNRVKLYPLIEWDMKEQDCLEYCYRNGWHWLEDGYELYDLLDRLSCKYCKNKNLKELRNIYHCLPKLWNELKELQRKILRPYNGSQTIFDLERCFRIEDSRLTIFKIYDIQEKDNTNDSHV